MTVRTTLVHNRSVGDQVTISGAGNAGYNQPAQVTITSVPTPRSFTFENAVAGPAELRRRHRDLHLAVPPRATAAATPS